MSEKGEKYAQLAAALKPLVLHNYVINRTKSIWEISGGTIVVGHGPDGQKASPPEATTIDDGTMLLLIEQGYVRALPQQDDENLRFVATETGKQYYTRSGFNRI